MKKILPLLVTCFIVLNVWAIQTNSLFSYGCWDYADQELDRILHEANGHMTLTYEEEFHLWAALYEDCKAFTEVPALDPQ